MKLSNRPDFVIFSPVRREAAVEVETRSLYSQIPLQRIPRDRQNVFVVTKIRYNGIDLTLISMARQPNRIRTGTRYIEFFVVTVFVERGFHCRYHQPSNQRAASNTRSASTERAASRESKILQFTASRQLVIVGCTMVKDADLGGQKSDRVAIDILRDFDAARHANTQRNPRHRPHPARLANSSRQTAVNRQRLTRRT